MIPDQSHGEKVLLRVKGEFLEMPGLRVTEAQARRLWGLDADSCGALGHELVRAKFLFRTRDGAFMRVECEALEDLRPTRFTRQRGVDPGRMKIEP